MKTRRVLGITVLVLRVSNLIGCATIEPIKPKVDTEVLNVHNRNLMCESNLRSEIFNVCSDEKHYLKSDCNERAYANDKFDIQHCYRLANKQFEQCRERAEENYRICLHE